MERVRLKIPNCDVCSSGAKLVDLPGVSDYNAARENVTKEVQFDLEDILLVKKNVIFVILRVLSISNTFQFSSCWPIIKVTQSLDNPPLAIY